MPSLIVTSSIDTTCTVWNIDTSTALTQLIAHDREVYDVAWLPNSTDIFVSVGADGSLRAFDLRSLEHSTILYETPPPKNPPMPTTPSAGSRPPTSPLLRIAFNPADNNYMSTFSMDGSDVQILDMRSPGSPVMELRAHRAPINSFGWSSTDSPLLATAGTSRSIVFTVMSSLHIPSNCTDCIQTRSIHPFNPCPIADDCQVLLWDLAPHSQAPAGSPQNASSRLSSPRPVDGKKRVISDPVMAYSAPSEITNLAWSPHIPSMTMNSGLSTSAGEWLAIVMGKSIKALKI